MIGGLLASLNGILKARGLRPITFPEAIRLLHSREHRSKRAQIHEGVIELGISLTCKLLFLLQSRWLVPSSSTYSCKVDGVTSMRRIWTHGAGGAPRCEQWEVLSEPFHTVA